MGVETPKDAVPGLSLAPICKMIRFPLHPESHYGEFLKRDEARLEERLPDFEVDLTPDTALSTEEKSQPRVSPA